MAYGNEMLRKADGAWIVSVEVSKEMALPEGVVERDFGRTLLTQALDATP